MPKATPSVVYSRLFVCLFLAVVFFSPFFPPITFYFFLLCLLNGIFLRGSRQICHAPRIWRQPIKEITSEIRKIHRVLSGNLSLRSPCCECIIGLFKVKTDIYCLIGRDWRFISPEFEMAQSDRHFNIEWENRLQGEWQTRHSFSGSWSCSTFPFYPRFIKPLHLPSIHPTAINPAVLGWTHMWYVFCFVSPFFWVTVKNVKDEWLCWDGELLAKIWLIFIAKLLSMWDGSQLTCARIGRLSKSPDMTWHDHSAYIDRSRTSSSDLYRSVSVSPIPVPQTISGQEDAAREKHWATATKKRRSKRQMDGWNTRRANAGRDGRKKNKKKKSAVIFMDPGFHLLYFCCLKFVFYLSVWRCWRRVWVGYPGDWTNFRAIQSALTGHIFANF